MTAISSPDQIDNLLNLSKLLLANMNVPEYHLTQEQIEWINTFIQSSPQALSNILDNIKNITSDGQINLHDIPEIVKLLADVYHSTIITEGLSNPSNIIVFIKYTIHVILDSPLFLLPNIEKQIMEKIIDSSLDLLSINISVDVVVPVEPMVDASGNEIVDASGNPIPNVKPNTSNLFYKCIIQLLRFLHIIS